MLPSEIHLVIVEQPILEKRLIFFRKKNLFVMWISYTSRDAILQSDFFGLKDWCPGRSTIMLKVWESVLVYKELACLNITVLVLSWVVSISIRLDCLDTHNKYAAET